MKMKSKIRWELIISSIICLLPIIMGVVLYNQLPETIATHFGLNGEPDGYSSKNFVVFGLPLLMFGLNIFLQFALNTDPKKQNMDKVLRSVAIWMVPVMSVMMSAFVLFKAIGNEVAIEVIVPVFVGSLFAIIGNYMPKTKQNYTMGIRLPWTLDSEENWNKTHRLAGYLWVVGGILMVVLSLLRLWTTWLLFVIIAVFAFIPAVFSYLYHKKELKERGQKNENQK